FASSIARPWRCASRCAPCASSTCPAGSRGAGPIRRFPRPSRCSAITTTGTRSTRSSCRLRRRSADRAPRRAITRLLVALAVTFSGAPLAGAVVSPVAPSKAWRTARPSLLAAPAVVAVAALFPRALLGPAVAPLVLPVRGRFALPLLPVSGRDVVVPHRHEQDGTRDELRSHHDPRAVVAAAHVPAAVGVDPVLVAVEEHVAGCRGRVLHGRDPRHDPRRRRSRQVNADVDVHLRRGRRRQSERENRQKNVTHRGILSFLSSSGV